VNVLRLDGVTRTFGGVAALTEITIDVEEGARHVVFGPNGAGKTTLFKVISGEIRPTWGTVEIFGRNATSLSPWRRSRMGLGRTFQVTNLFFDLTVADNVLLARQAVDRGRFNPVRARRSMPTLVDDVARILDQEGLTHVAGRPVREIAYGEQRLLEIAVTLATEPKLILLDEPTAGVPTADAARLVERIRALPRSITVVLIEHDLEVAFAVSETATVLANGALIAHGPLEEVRADPNVQDVYVGSANIHG
jgi:ABC-type branched-subunit amino acid transport system ATPase component